MKKQQIHHPETPIIRKYTPKEPDGIEIFETGSTAPTDFMKNKLYLNKKDDFRFYLVAMGIALGMIAMLMISAASHYKKPAILPDQSSQSVSE